MAGPIWRHGYRDDQPDERAGGREQRLKKMYAEERLKADILQEALTKKL